MMKAHSTTTASSRKTGYKLSTSTNYGGKGSSSLKQENIQREIMTCVIQLQPLNSAVFYFSSEWLHILMPMNDKTNGSL